MDHETGDREFVLATRNGDPEAFTALVRRHQEVAFRAAYLIVRDAQAAEDVAQESFLRAYNNLGRFREEEPFRPWLLRIVTNLALNEVRSRRRRFVLFDRAKPQAEQKSPPADRALVSGETRIAVWDAVNQLGEDDRVVLYLRYFLELPEREIAEVIGKAPGTVKSRLSRASGRLRQVIETNYPDLRESGLQAVADE